MSISDNKKNKAREHKNADTEKEHALAVLQNSFLGSQAPKAEFLNNPVLEISPALLPKKDRIKLQTFEKTHHFGECSLSLAHHSESIKLQLQANQANTAVSTADIKAASEKSVSQNTCDQNSCEEPISNPTFGAPGTITAPDSVSVNTSEGAASDLKSTPAKPLTSFDLLGVGLSSNSVKTKSFLAHFAKDEKKDKK